MPYSGTLNVKYTLMLDHMYIHVCCKNMLLTGPLYIKIMINDSLELRTYKN